jgi:starvation-inducible DNA-binding protein
MRTTILGLDKTKSEHITEELNVLLASFQTYYQNLRGIHWNIKGKRFFELHVKFEELYTDATVKVDDIAERILTLGGQPLHTFEDYIKASKVSVGKNVTNDEKSVELIITSLSSLLQLERQVLNLSDDAQDEGTNSLMSDFIAEQEKTLWMMQSWLTV